MTRKKSIKKYQDAAKLAPKRKYKPRTPKKSEPVFMNSFVDSVLIAVMIGLVLFIAHVILAFIS